MMQWLISILLVLCTHASPLFSSPNPQRPMYCDNGGPVNNNTLFADALTTLSPFLRALEKVITPLRREAGYNARQLTVAAVDTLILDIEFICNKNTCSVLIRKDLFAHFKPEQLEVVIAARVAHWLTSSQWDAPIKRALKTLELMGCVGTGGNVLHVLYRTVIEKKPFSMSNNQLFFSFIALCVAGAAYGTENLLALQRTYQEYAATSDLIVSPEARAFLLSLSTQNRWALHRNQLTILSI